ncbi:MAG TPA: nitroreductase family protein [Rickettsiales bacterium]|nr:nitroreductase family protein [Rickettsiales bacterium]
MFSKFKTKPVTETHAMSVTDAIYHRRAVRNYTPEAINHETIKALLDAAVQAPTAMHEEPWAFAVIQNKEMLDRLSRDAKELVRQEAFSVENHMASHALKMVNNPDFNVFYNAGTLVVIYSKMHGPFVKADCWLAAENLMLAACDKGLGSCVIGFAVSALNSAQWKAELEIPVDMVAVVPIILGVPAGETTPVPRKPAEILTWQ